MEGGQTGRLGRRDVVRAAVVAAGAAWLTGCDADTGARPTSSSSPGTTVRHEKLAPSASTPSTSTPSASSPPFSGRIYSADLLIRLTGSVPASLLTALTAAHGVAHAITIGLSSASVSGRTLVVAAVDPSSFRGFTPAATAQADDVWDRLTDGEAALDPDVGRRVEQPAGYLTLGQGTQARSVHVGAYAPLLHGIQAAVGVTGGAKLGIPGDNALLVSTGEYTPSAVLPHLKALLPTTAVVQTLATEFDLDAVQTAVLTGQNLSEAVGTFTYTAHPDGTVTPDPAWVQRYIRTETFPIIGSVTGNVSLFPQLRAVLNEVVERGLAPKIFPQQYGGCYVPRYIAYDPKLGLSLHSWGIAVDLNVPENLRGTKGHMDPGIVETFKSWGFDWGGDWHYTDPMHFEMSRVVEPS